MKPILSIIGPLLALWAWVPETAHAEPPITGIAYVIDGDTLDIHGKRIRLHGVDAPESAQTCVRDGKPWPSGRAVSNILADHIGRSTVMCDGKATDRYGRTIAECFIGEDSINRWLVANGLAFAYRKYSNDYIQEEDAARSRRIGLWAMTCEAPWDYRRSKKRSQ